MNNVLMISDFARPFPIRQLPSYMFYTPIHVRIDGDFFTLWFQRAVCADGIVDRLICRDKGSKGIAPSHTWRPII